MSVQPNLFGGYSLIRNWGRIGTGGQMRIEFYRNQALAAEAKKNLIHSKLRRGYY